LIDEERDEYNDEKDKFAEDIDNLKKLGDAKMKIIKNKLVTLYDG
jgi:hypothetical protein